MAHAKAMEAAESLPQDGWGVICHSAGGNKLEFELQVLGIECGGTIAASEGEIAPDYSGEALIDGEVTAAIVGRATSAVRQSP